MMMDTRFQRVGGSGTYCSTVVNTVVVIVCINGIVGSSLTASPPVAGWRNPGVGGT